MSLEKILSISGRPGLYELKTQTRGGFVAESLLEEKKITVNARHDVSMLTEISIYTYENEVPLNEVFQKISKKEGGKEAINHKATKEKLADYFREVLPEYDEDQVYASDIKKVIQWYNLLVKKGITDFSEPEEEELEEGESKKKADPSPKEAAPKPAPPKTNASKPTTKKGDPGRNAATRKV